MEQERTENQNPTCCGDSPYFGFDRAIREIIRGNRVCRKNWNGKNMFIYLKKGSIFDDGGKMIRTASVEGVSVNLFDSGDKGTTTRLPNINMETSQGNTVTGWLASQTDMLAEDWMIC
jgi:hypothetical protein